MIIKGTSCAGASRLAAHLNRTDTNERTEVKEIRGVAADDLAGALREMEAVAVGTRATKPFYHGSINTRDGEQLTSEQRALAIDRLEAALGLTGQARVVVIHEKEGREHCHIVWSRIDFDRMTAISDSHNYRKHEEVARSLEREFGLQRVQGAHIERDGTDRPKRTPSHSEMLQAERTGVGTQQAKDLMTGVWTATRTGKEFQAVLEDKGWILARGDRRDFVAIDPTGGVHSIARRIDSAKAADVRLRFADIDPQGLASVTEAKQVQRQRFGASARQASEKQPALEVPSVKPNGASQAPGPKSVSGAPRVVPSAGKVADGLFSALLGEKPAPKPKERAPPHMSDAAQPSQRRQELMRQLSREIPSETERDAEIERDRGRERDRG